MKNIHYVYKITNNNPSDTRKYYIGVRTAKGCDPLQDEQYMGSSPHLNKEIKKNGLEQFSKEILSTWKTRELANLEESRLHHELMVCTNPEFYNMMNSGPNGVNTLGFVSAIDKISGNYVSITKKEFEENKHLVGIVKGKVSVRNKHTGKTCMVSKKEFYNNDDLEHIHKNIVVAIDTKTGKRCRVDTETFNKNKNFKGIASETITVFNKITGKSLRVTKEEFDENENLVAVSKGLVTAINIKSKKAVKVTKEEFENNSDLIHPTASILRIFDENHNLVETITKRFAEICKKKGYPTQRFRWSYQNNGKPIYQDELSGSNKSQLTKKGYLQFKGWYVKREKVKR